MRLFEIANDRAGFSDVGTMRNLVTIFNVTRWVSQTGLKKATKQMVKRSKVYHFMSFAKLDDVYSEQIIDFQMNGTVNQAYEEVDTAESRVAMLNFADALVPGGLVLYGATTQEENICRCSNLYESLIAKTAYYKENARHEEHTDNPGSYTDCIIYSPGVTVFRDDLTYEIVDPKTVDVITCPSPIVGVDNNMDILRNRIRKILRAAQLNHVDTIILGAWGCGAFGQKTEDVAQCFAEVLSEVNAFRKVVFAIRANESITTNKYYVFRDTFLTYYKGKENENE